jgi:hypothetical protein
MELSDMQFAQELLAQLKAEYQADLFVDWGEEAGKWKDGSWSRAELEKLYKIIPLMAESLCGKDKFVRYLGGVTIRKADIGSHGGEALAHQVTLSTRGAFSAWTLVHELSHAWDANYGWSLSRRLERYTGGFTSPLLSRLRQLAGFADCGRFQPENKPGRYGRWPGCNQAGYFYGDKPSGSNWSFNRVEDFAESVAMYVGWGSKNDLSDWAEARLKRYLLPNGENDKNFGTDNWTDYAKYFYPAGGDYTKTKRWQFVDDLVHERIDLT